MAVTKKVVSINDTPVEVAPVEVAPVEVAPVEVAPVEVAPVVKSFVFGANDKIMVRNNSDKVYNSYVESIEPGETGWAHGYETYSNDFLEVV